MIIPAGTKLLSSDGGATSADCNFPVASSTVSIASELAPLDEVVSVYANCDDAFAAGPMAKNADGADSPPGPGPAVIVAVVVAKLLPPAPTVTVRVTVHVQGLAYVCVVVACAMGPTVAPSPKFQLKAGTWPGGMVDADPSNVTATPTFPV